MLDLWIDRFFLAIAALMAFITAVLWSWDTLAVDVVALIIAACLGIVALRRLFGRFISSGTTRTVLSIVLTALGVFLLKHLLSI